MALTMIRHKIECAETEPVKFFSGTDQSFFQTKPSDTEHLHCFNMMGIGICRRGYGTVFLENSHTHYERGTMIILPKGFGARIQEESKDSALWEYLFFDPTAILKSERVSERIGDPEEISGEVTSGSFCVQMEDAPLLIQETNLVMNQMRLKELAYMECVRYLMHCLLIEIVRIHRADLTTSRKNPAAVQQNDYKLEKIVSYVDEHLAENFQVSDLAREMQLSENSLRSLIQEHFHESPVQYLNRQRIEKACGMLKNTRLGICEIGYHVGYENPTTFFSNFRKYTGKTPKEWKKDLLKEK